MKKRRVIIGIGTVVVMALAANMFMGDQSFPALYRNHRAMRNLSAQLKSSRNVIDSLRVEIDRLQHDTTYIERIAREKYGMARQDEKMYKFIEGK